MAGRRHACIDPEIESSKVNITGSLLKCAASVGMHVDDCLGFWFAYSF